MGANAVAVLLLATCAWVVLAVGFRAVAAEPPTQPAAEKPTTVTKQCANDTCHANLLGRKYAHGLVSQQKCLQCHKYVDPARHTFKSAFPKGQQCGNCHELKLNAVAHKPVVEGKCTACHDPHGSRYKAMLVSDPSHGLCVKCHKEADFLKKKFIHGPVAKGDCNACHEPHYSPEPKLLRASIHDVCVGCHKEMNPKRGVYLSVHVPVRDNCTSCHDPHASNVKSVLRQAAPKLCYSCHQDVKADIATSKVVHRAATDKGGCSNCHEPHFSKQRNLQVKPQPEECLSCHNRVLTATDGKNLTDMASLLAENPSHHGPIRLGSCTACHKPHASKHFRLLMADYPAEFYAPFKMEQYALCFRCHVPDLVLNPKGKGLTLFRDGDKNLHWLHVNQKKGRTCRACHEVHASKRPFHIREAVPFGPMGWMLEIDFKETPTGGSCSPGCHVKRSYNNGGRPTTAPAVVLQKGVLERLHAKPTKPRPKPTTMPVEGPAEFPVSPPPFSKNMYPCTGCHDPDQVVNTERRTLVKAHTNIRLRHDEKHRWCLDCHNANNRDVLRSASGEPITFGESYKLCGQCHGDKYKDWKAGIHGKRTGQWDGRKQYLLCVNCHDPHSPKFKSVKPMPPPVRMGQAK